MRIFVASWFFPPSTSSEGIVTYKLLRNSRHQYDVVSSTSNQWGYANHIEMQADNIRVLPVETDDLNVWRDACVEMFEKLHAEAPYDAIMTRCMPNESLQVGLAIKEKHPELKWICSLADPVANNPYWLHAIENIKELSKADKKRVIQELSLTKEKWSRDWLSHPSNSVRDQFFWKNVQDQALKKADMLITPSVEQRDYMDPTKLTHHKFLVVPHSYDESLYPAQAYGADWETGKTHLTFTGYSDSLRSLKPVIEAARWIRERYPRMLEHLKIHFFGNYPREIVDCAYAWQLEDVFDFQGNVSYLDTLAIMKKSDWLIHLDAWFENLAETGGSIFFAGKLADYMGAGKPILALTGANSPAGVIVSQYGGEVLPCWEIPAVAQTLMQIIQRESIKEINAQYRQLFDARKVANLFDDAAEALAYRTESAKEEIVIGESKGDKALTICVPSFNAQMTLARTLNSLLNVELLDGLEVIVVDDGSGDRTAQIGREYVERYPETVMLVSKPNGGHGSGINVGLRLAKGQYFRVVDSDDWVDTKALDEEIRYIQENRAQADVIYTPYHIVDQSSGDNLPWPLSETIQTGRLYTFRELVDEIGVQNFYFTMAGTSFCTDLLREVGLKLKEKSFYTDSTFILEPIPAVNTAVFLPKPVYKYLRGQAEQSVAPLSFVRHYTDHEAIVRELICFEQSTDMDAAHRAYMKYILNQHLITNYRILLEFDPDVKDGLAKAKAFDKWLQEKAPSYYDWTKKHITLAKIARNSAYQEERFRRLRKIALAPQRSFKSTAKNGLKIIAHSKLIMNQFTMEFLREQKESNGVLYKAYKRLK